MVLRVTPVTVPATGDWSFEVPGQWEMDVLAVTGTLLAGDPNKWGAVLDMPISALPAGYPFSVEYISSMPYLSAVTAPRLSLLTGQPVAPPSGLNGISWDWPVTSNANLAGYAFSGAFIPGAYLGVTWPHHWVLTVDGGGGARVYRNGVLVGTLGTGVTFLTFGFANLRWGTQTSGNVGVAFGCFPGTLQALALYGAVLTPAQVAAHFAAIGGSAGYQAAVLAQAPRAFYLLDEAQPTPVAVDSSGNGRNATYHQNDSGLQVPGLFGWGNAFQMGGLTIPTRPTASGNVVAALSITDGTSEIVRVPAPVAAGSPITRTYAWATDQKGTIPDVNAAQTYIGVPPLWLPAGYVIRSVTTTNGATPAWSNVNIWWDDHSADPPHRGDYRNVLILG